MTSNLKRNLAVLLLGTAATTGVGLAASGLASAQQNTTPPAFQQQTSPEPNAKGAPASTEVDSKDKAAEAGGGHADPAGQNVDHQFEGVE